MSTYSSNPFADRHIGPREHEIAQMLEAIGLDSLDALVDAAVPAGIRRRTPMSLEERKRYLEVPPAIVGPISELAKRWVGPIATDWEEANAIEAEYQRGSAFIQMGKPIEAEKAFRRALEIRDDWTLAMAQLGSLLGNKR